MTDDARRALTEEEWARALDARTNGEACAGCGRALDAGEPVWWAPLLVRGVYGRLSRRWAPVAQECAPPELVRVAEVEEPEPCLVCGRGIYYPSADRPRDLALCSKRCRSRHGIARFRRGA